MELYPVAPLASHVNMPCRKKAWTKVGNLFGRETSKNAGGSPSRTETVKTLPRKERGDLELDSASLADLLIGATPTKQQQRHSPPKCLEQQQAALLATFDTTRPPTPTPGSPTRHLLPPGTKPAPPAAAPLMQRVGAVEENERAEEVTPKGYQSNPLFEAPPKPSLAARVEEAHQQALLEQWEQHQAELAAAESRLQQLLAQAEANYHAQMGAAQQKLAKRLLTQMAPAAREEAYKHKVRELQRKIAGDAHRFERAAREQAGQVAYLQSKLRELSKELQGAKRVTEITLAAVAGAGAGSNPGSPVGKPRRQLSLGAGSFTGGRLSRQPSFAGSGIPAAKLLPPQQSGSGAGGCPSPTGRLSQQSSLGGSPMAKLPPSPFGGGASGPAGATSAAGAAARSAQHQMLVSDLPAKLARASDASSGTAGSPERGGGKAAQPPRFDIHVTACTIAAGRLIPTGPQAGSSGSGKGAGPGAGGDPGKGMGAMPPPGTATDSKVQAKGQLKGAASTLREEGAWELQAGRARGMV
ncbi:hypothetical protein N2152v2_003282 [Parachlorella kessleri]